MLAIKHKINGFSLVEVIIALGVFSILAAGVFNIVTSSYKNFYGVGDKQVISEFAQEGMEIVRAIRDNSWQDIENVSGAGNQGVSKASAGYWQFSGTSNTLGVLTRTIAISDVSRDSNNEIVLSGGTNDPSTKKVVVTVTGTGISDYVLTVYLTDWNNKTWLQTNWSGVGEREYWSDSTMASSTYTNGDNNISTSTTGALTLFWNGTTFDSPGYLYSSIYDINSDDKEPKSISVEQVVPSPCNLDITLEVSDDISFAVANISSQIFSDDSTSYYTSSTPASLNGKRYMRYRVDMASCSSGASSPTLYSVKINYR
ncbi:MAG: prepilin-type N-terminal cleavage/methylation domain-containing protein [Patescibacteria group bacterium]|jgi:prepilin-type N-terminal cleavage/methylation domain-containing protein